MRSSARLITASVFVAALGIAVGITLRLESSSSGDAGFRHGVVSVHGDRYRYAVYVPPTTRAGSPAPLVVVLHGCTMTANQMAAASQYDALAKRDRFIVLYPDVDLIDIGNGRCWKGIWAPEIEGRGTGDAAAIAEMTQLVMTRWRVDRRRVYSIGISAGGFESALLGIYYPDLYAAIGIHSGALYIGGEPECLFPGTKAAAVDTVAHAAFAAMGPRARVVPVIVVHGDTDPTVPYACGQQVISEWIRADNLLLRREQRAEVPGSPTQVLRSAVPGGHRYSVRSYADSSGCVVAQLWTVHGMGHFWSGGSTDPASARYSDPRGPSAATASWSFFSRWTRSGSLRC
jgi:poly(hydroxyalkanoate) depolymerase family esterase